MKLLFENWRKYLKEADGNMREFVFSESELSDLNRSISKIVSAAKSALGADGPTPLLSPKNLEKIKLDTSQRDPAPLKMVAEQDADVIDLRQRYHGPEGELKKSGPRTVKGLEKGLGQMSAQEFEETGYVLKVPQEVLEDFNLLIQETKKSGDLYTQARDWYHNIRELLNQETNNDRDATLLGLLIAVYSPRAKFSLNLAEASFMYKAVQEDAANNPELLREYLETFAGAEKREPGKPHGFTGAHKVPNFALNLIAPDLAGERDKDTGKMKYNDLYEWNSTIDTWMIDAFYPMLRKASTAKEWNAIKGKLMSNVVSYRYMARLVAQEARKFNLLPHELQAIIWVSMQVRQTGEAGLGVTTQFAFNQIKQAMMNIRVINTDLEDAKKELEEKSWLGTLFDEIDNKGFQEAAKFILGIKNEKGKITVPGVRSIAASGKSGSAFQYYTPPEEDSQEKSTLKKDKKPAAKKEPKPKPEKRFADPKYSELKTYYVMNEVIQMPTGKFNNLYDAITLYLDPEFSTEKAVEYITGRFDPEATASSKYFKEGKMLKELAAGYSPNNPAQWPMRPGIGVQNLPPGQAHTMGSTGEKIPADSGDSEQVVKAVVHRNNQILLLQNEKGYDLPGGHIKRGENVLKGMQREIFEETGLTIGADVAKLYLHKKNMHFFVVELPSDDIHLSSEHSGYKIMPFEVALKQSMSSNYKEAIKKAMEIIVGADSLRSQDDATRLTLTPDGSRQERAPHAPLRRQTRPLAEASRHEKQEIARCMQLPINDRIQSIKLKVMKALTARYCFSGDRNKTISCFVQDVKRWILGGTSAPAVVRVFANYFNISISDVEERIKQKWPNFSTIGETIELMANEYVTEIMPKIAAGLGTPVQILPPHHLAGSVEGSRAGRRLRSQQDVYGSIAMGHFPRSRLIGVRCDVERWYIKSKGTKYGLEEYLFVGLYHEFQHGFDRELKVSGKTSFLAQQKALMAPGKLKTGYYSQQDEFYAEWEALLNQIGRAPNKEDVRMLCKVYRKWGSAIHQRIKWKDLNNYKITRGDHIIASPVLQGVMNCDNEDETLARMQALTYKVEKKQELAERRKRK